MSGRFMCGTKLGGLLFCAVLLGMSSALADDAVCLECHEQHGSNTIFEHASRAVSCTVCHGASTDHADRPRNPVDINFTTASGMLENGACLGCHDDSSRIHWQSDEHAAADLSCVGCHDIHTPRDPILQGGQEMAICTDCHRSVLAEFNLPSRHPVQEGKAACSSCHAPHGSHNEAMLQGVTPVEGCVECHREKRGPFLFEHDPVTEDCAHCHEPHGSVTPALLTTRSPFLCQECHMAASHPSRIPDGSSMRLLDPNLLARGCVNCHSQVHGSNHPSGGRLTR